MIRKKKSTINNSDEEGYSFKCKKCGCDYLIVKIYGINKISYTETQDCTCSKNKDGLAYKRNSVLYVPYVEFYRLDEEHHFNEKADGYEEELRDPKEKKIKEKIYCKNCYDPQMQNDVEKNYLNEDNDQEDLKFYVICGNCQREIEFGWSHPDRGGRIWPAECSDFNPWKSWPELRYIKRWAKRNWLRPDS